MSKVRAQFLRAVNKSQIEKRQDGWTIRDVVPVIDDIVMNGGLYPGPEIDKSVESLSGVPAPIGHPQDSQGNYISAMRGEGLRNYYAGVTVENVRKDGEKVLVDLEINQEQMKSHPLYDKIVAELNSGESMHVSTGLVLQKIATNGESRGKKYTWMATNMMFDHLALLPSWEGPGAATPEQGVGIMANGAELFVNLDEYEAEGLSESEQAVVNSLFDKVKAMFAPLIGGGYNSTDAQMMPNISNSGDTDMELKDVEALIDKRLDAVNEGMDKKYKELEDENKKLKEELNGMKAKMNANEQAELETKVNRAVELTGEEAKEFEGMSVNALDKIIKLAEGNKPAFAANASRGIDAVEKETHAFPA